MRIALCDDQREFLDKIKSYLKEYEKNHEYVINIVTFQNGKELIDFYKENQHIDLIILDILMEKMDGIQVARKIREYGSRTKIAFLSSTDRYSLQGYLVNACRYWVKPMSYTMFKNEMDTICSEIEEDKKLYFIEKIGTTTKLIYFSDIIYIETFKRKIMIHTVHEKIITSQNMKSYEMLLNSGDFYRCHAAYIVNMSYIKEISGLEIKLKNKESVFISKNKKKDFLEAFACFTGEILKSTQKRAFAK